MRTMYDSVTPDAIPADAEIVAGYLDGTRYAWPSTAWRRWGASTVRIYIVVDSHHHYGDVLDVEQGDAPPEHAPIWARARRAAGADPTIYCAEGTWPAVKAAFEAAGESPPHYWIARPGARELLPGTVATQYAYPGPYDLSVVADDWHPGPSAQAPAAAGGTATAQGDAVTLRLPGQDVAGRSAAVGLALVALLTAWLLGHV